MTSVSNKINKLVSTSENDLTAELEIPDFFPDDRERDDHDPEADANAVEFEASAVPDRPTNGTATPEPDSRTSSIDRLQLDIDQLREKWTGLEREIEAREKLTNDLNAEIEQLNGKLNSALDELDAREKISNNLNAEIEQLNGKLNSALAELEAREKITNDLNAEIDQLNGKLNSTLDELEAREKTTNDLNAEIDQLNGKLNSASDELEQARVSAEQSSAEIEQFHETVKNNESRIRDLEAQLAASKEKIGTLELQLQESWSRQKEDSEKITVRDRQVAELEQQLARQVSESEGLKTDNAELRRELQNDAALEIERSHKLIAEQSGRLTGNEQLINELTARVNRTERYADDLRRKFQEQAEIAEHAVGQMQDLQSACTTAQDKVSDLSASYADTKQQNAALKKKISKLERDFEKVSDLSADYTDTKQQNAALKEKLSKLQKDFDEEVRQIRFELGAAQETITDQDTINVQLTSDLYDTKGFQQALETKLKDANEKHKKEIRKLEQEANKLRNQQEDYEYKLENKDSAIAALMDELANRSESLESIGEIENVIQEIDDRMSERLDEQDTINRERVTRLLVGESDGQEVRFPLFKDRLTIGRTAHNDIQLNTQCISRRHAVILTENGSTKIVDWGSKNGVFINERRVAEQILKNGDVVMIGTTGFRYEERSKR
jgi:chromosome segregation ATPase